MRRLRSKIFAISTGMMLVFNTAIAGATASSSTTPTGLTREELETKIQEKAQALETINQQLESTKKTLQDTKSQRMSLQRELNTLQSNENQLTLNIKADELTIQKLNLEVDSLSYDLNDIKSSIEDKRNAISQLLKDLQKSSEESGNLFIVFLKNKSLADGVLEAQTVKNLQLQLTSDIGNLRELHDAYNQKLDAATGRKQSISYHEEDLQNRKAILQDQKVERQAILVQTKDRESVYSQKLAELQKQQQQIANEIETFDAVLRTKIDPATLPAPGPGVLAIPIDGDKSDITQGYGATEFAKNGYRGHWHNGVDFGEPIGTPVYAAESGTIAATGDQDKYCYRGAYGKFIVIAHENNLVTLYGHLSKQVVQKGDTVKRGDLIGYVGKTGYATGPHLHFTVFAKPTFYMGPSKSCGQMPFGGDLNPISYL